MYSLATGRRRTSADAFYPAVCLVERYKTLSTR